MECYYRFLSIPYLQPNFIILFNINVLPTIAHPLRKSWVRAYIRQCAATTCPLPLESGIAVGMLSKENDVFISTSLAVKKLFMRSVTSGVGGQFHKFSLGSSFPEITLIADAMKSGSFSPAESAIAESKSCHRILLKWKLQSQ